MQVSFLLVCKKGGNKLEALRRLLLRDRPYFLTALIIFIFGAFMGIQFYHNYPKEALNVIENALKTLQGLTHGHPIIQILVIFLNNTLKGIGALILGFLICFPPFLMLFGNGFIVGLLLMYWDIKLGLNPGHFFLLLAPHGVLELPAIFIATGIGIKFGVIPFKKLWRINKQDESYPDYREFFKELPRYLLLIVGMLFVAAIIEVTVTPFIISLFHLRG